MSGGHFDYKQYQIQAIIDSIEQLIIDNDSQELDEWGIPISKNYSSDTIEQFKIGNTVLKVAQIYAQRIDWLVSGDDSESSFIKRIENDLKLIGDEILGLMI
jgi:hypothetical protein